MKKLIFIGGPMGIGKTTVCQVVSKKIKNSVFLDGDWCWQINPFIVNDENKKMVLSNIQFLLNSFLNNSNIDTILFYWVMDEQVIIDDILEKVSIDKVNFYSISLISSSEKLKKNIEKDIKRNLRETAGIDDSLSRLKKYNSVDSFKVDISNMNIEETSKKIQFLINN